MDPAIVAPHASLVAATDEARAALGGKAAARLTTFPFKIGRESRMGAIDRLRSEIERRMKRAPQLNDLYLVEPMSHLLQISREHLEITWEDGRWIVADRGSANGTIVAGIRLGGNASATYAELADGDEIIVGTAQSPYVFRFEVTTAKRTS